MQAKQDGKAQVKPARDEFSGDTYLAADAALTVVLVPEESLARADHGAIDLEPGFGPADRGDAIVAGARLLAAQHMVKNEGLQFAFGGGA